jgi:transcription elongation GreA/GreB family factor
VSTLIDPSLIDKEKIIALLIQNLKIELAQIEEAAKSSRDLATQADLKSEGKYDTRAIEASYLAGAQSRRVEEIKLDIQMLEEIELPKRTHDENSKLQMGSLGMIRFNGHDKLYFLSSTSGGSLIEVDGHTILVISVFSPIGDGALGLSKGESFEVETPRENREYKILNVY